MRASSLLGITLRQASKDLEIKSAILLERAGYVRQLGSGIFTYMHLAQRSLQKVEQILREEMNRIGGVEISMPVVHPAEPWRKTGRYDAIDDSLVRFQDRKEADMVLAMTHEEVVATLVRSEISTYRQFPKLIYQIQTKFRDEMRPRAGLIRVREFAMKDSYSLDTSWEGLLEQYIRHYDAYYRIGARMGLKLAAVESDVGMMGGKMAHEFMYLNEIGEDTIFICSETNRRSNKEVASIGKVFVDIEAKPLEKVHTPGTKTIADLAGFLNVEAKDTAKVVFFMARKVGEEEEKLVLAIVRGDMEVNNVKLKNLLEAVTLRPAVEEEITAVGCSAGYASAVGIDRKKAIVIADDLVAKTNNLVSGANEKDYHLLNCCYGRDWEADVVQDIVFAYDGAPSGYGNGVWRSERAVEFGNIFQLGTKYTDAMDASFMNVQGRPDSIIMGSYGIGVGRALACVAEEFNDDNGLLMPITVAPYHVNLISLADSPETIEAGEKLYQLMVNAGIEVIYDDRHKKVAGPGAKFKDADLRGIPIRVTISKKSMEKGGLEVKFRRDSDFEIVPTEDILGKVQEMVLTLFAEINQVVDNCPTWETEQAPLLAKK